MTDPHTLFDVTDAGPVLRLHVQPGAGRSQVTGTFGDALKVKVAAPPEGGRANAAVAKLLAELLDVAESAIELQSGEKSRAKKVLLRAADPDLLARAIDSLLTAEPARGRSSPRKRA